MNKILRSKKAQSILEYTTIIIVVLAMMFIMQRYIQKGMQGRWKEVGDSFGYGRQYDPDTTVVTERNSPDD